MAVHPLPPNPNLERLKKTAKDLRDLVRAGVDGAVATVRQHHPRLGSLRAGSPEAMGFKLADAQLTVARHHGFASWPRLVRCVQEMRPWLRSPHDRLGDDGDDGGRLIRLACLNYGDDSPQHVEAALASWRANPAAGSSSVFAAAAVGDHAGVRTFVAADRGAAGRSGGPFDWPPLLYATYSRLVTGDPGHDFVETVRVLLRAGADPNSGFLWDGLLPPFTALTGAVGRGEQGGPPHGDELAVLQLLLAAGADPNDGQAIYNAGIGNARPADDTAWLRLLFSHGFGAPRGGPWYQRFGERLSEPSALMAELLHDAARRGLQARARLLLDHGADPNRAGDHPVLAGRTPFRDAVENGYPELASMLVAAGARPDGVDPVERIIGRCLAGDSVSPAGAAIARRHAPDLVRVACQLGKPPAVIRGLVELGWDVNAKNATTALHEAAGNGALETVQVLVALGGDLAITDDGFDATPAGWADHFGHTTIRAYLEGLLP